MAISWDFRLAELREGSGSQGLLVESKFVATHRRQRPRAPTVHVLGAS